MFEAVCLGKEYISFFVTFSQSIEKLRKSQLTKSQSLPPTMQRPSNVLMGPFMSQGVMLKGAEATRPAPPWLTHTGQIRAELRAPRPAAGTRISTPLGCASPVGHLGSPGEQAHAAEWSQDTCSAILWGSQQTRRKVQYVSKSRNVLLPRIMFLSHRSTFSYWALEFMGSAKHRKSDLIHSLRALKVPLAQQWQTC